MRHQTWATVPLAVLALAASVAGAQDIDTGTPPDPSGSAFVLGRTNVNQAISGGQTFSAPTGLTQLNEFSFWTRQAFMFETVQYRAYLMAWGGLQPTGDVLWSSALVSGTTSVEPERVTFNVGGLTLASDQVYIAFLTPEGFTQSMVQQYGAMFSANTEGDLYAGGQGFIAFHDPEDGLAALTATNWSTVGDGTDMAFTADFAGATAVVPEPRTILLLGTGLGLLALVGRRRGRA